MNGEELSPEDHIVRYVKPGSMHEGRVDGSEFQLNPVNGYNTNFHATAEGKRKFLVQA